MLSTTFYTNFEEKLKESEQICDANQSEEAMSDIDRVVFKAKHDHRTEGAIIRSRANWCENGENNNYKYFHNLDIRKKIY